MLCLVFSLPLIPRYGFSRKRGALASRAFESCSGHCCILIGGVSFGISVRAIAADLVSEKIESFYCPIRKSTISKNKIAFSD